MDATSTMSKPHSSVKHVVTAKQSDWKHSYQSPIPPSSSSGTMGGSSMMSRSSNDGGSRMTGNGSGMISHPTRPSPHYSRPSSSSGTAGTGGSRGAGGTTGTGGPATTTDQWEEPAADP
ncbi:hypothetical protein ACA910_008418 [Epithemia clementina (nom. ined.)]